MEFKCTKGRWKPVYNRHYFDIKTSIDDYYQSLASTNCNIHLGMTEETEKANALLISKAPDMLEMLQRIVEYGGVANYNNIKQLIKEATEVNIESTTDSIP